MDNYSIQINDQQGTQNKLILTYLHKDLDLKSTTGSKIGLVTN